MKPLFGGMVLIFIFFFIEIQTAGNLNKIKTKYTDTAAELDDQARRDDHRTTLIIGTPARPKKRHVTRGHHADFELECETDETGEKAQNMFLHHYQERALPNTPDTTLALYNERRASGSYRLPEKQGGTKTNRFEEARRWAYGPFVEQHHQEMYQHHQVLQDHSESSGSSAKGLAAYNRYQNVHKVGDQSDESEMGSGYNHPYTAPPMTPSEDLGAHFNIQPPEHLNFEEKSSQNNPSAAALIDNYYIHLMRKYGDHSRGSGSG